MAEHERTAAWINSVLKQLSLLEHEKGITILQECGRECTAASALLEGAFKVGNVSRNADPEELFRIFKQQYYNTPNLSKTGSVITLVFEECTCPMYRKGVTNPYLCSCTTGFSRHIFETLFGRPVTVTLLGSILKGDDVCKQEIVIEDE